MAAPSSRQNLIDYCMRNLGWPVIEINVDDDQVSDRVDEALQFYREYHSDAIVRNYRKHQITQDDITNKYITLPSQMLFVSRIFPLVKSAWDSNSMWSARYQLALNDLYDLRWSGSLVHYEMTRQYLQTLDMVLNTVPPVRFSRHMNRIFMDIEWSQDIKVGDYVIVDGYEALDPDVYTSIYNDMFLKKYTTALIKKQWGSNLIKFIGMELPGGVKMDGQKIYDDAVEEIAKLEDEAQLKYEAPPVFFTG